MKDSLLRRGLLLLTRGLLLLACGVVTFHPFNLFAPFGSEPQWYLPRWLSLGLVLLYVPLSRWLAAPSRAHLAARLPWVLWFLLPLPLAALALSPWVLLSVPMWGGPSSYEYVPNPLVQATLGLYLFVTALVLATGRPTVPRAMLRLAGPWTLLLVALVLRFSSPPPSVYDAF